MQVQEGAKKSEGYRGLLVWQKAVTLAKDVYKLTEGFPKSQQYGLTNQIQRAAVSIASNIAEGSGRNGTKEFIYHVGIAQGSLYELQTQLVIACEIGFVSQEALEVFVNSTDEIGRMLNGLVTGLKRRVYEAN